MSASRIISTLVALGLALIMLFLGGWYFTVCFGIIIYLAQNEYFELVKIKGNNPATKLTVILTQILLIITTIAPNFADMTLAISGCLICFYLLFQSKIATIADISSSIFGLFYGGYLPSYWIRLRVNLGNTESNLPLNGYFPTSWGDFAHLPMPLSITLLGFMCLWAADIGAYIVGKNLGKTQLSNISPKKTVEGALFGIFGAMFTASIGSWYLQWDYWLLMGCLFGGLVAVVGLFGDLIESLIKRDVGVKDSSELIPGHGGMLDRTDSYVFTAPIVYYFITVLLPLV